MKLTRIYLTKRLEVLCVCTFLLLSYLFFFINAAAASSESYSLTNLQGTEQTRSTLIGFALPSPETYLTLNSQETSSVVIEGTVEQIVSESQPNGLIISRAFVAVDKVIQGVLQDSQVVIRYQGGTVGDITLIVSHEPQLAEGMRLQATLTPDESGDYRIVNPDTDLAILEDGIGVSYTLTGAKWPDSSIPVPMRINANTDDVPGDGERTAVQNAMNTWTNASCSYFAYQYQAGSCTAGPTKDGVNCISWVNQTNGNMLGNAYYWWSGNYNTVETDIVLYDGSTFPKWTTSLDTVEFDVESVTVHELGHALGLSHNNASPDIVMYPTLGKGQIVRNLHTDDINGVCSLYPNSSAPSPPNPPNGLTASQISSTKIKLLWTDNSNNESGFKIERSPNGTSNWTEIDNVGANTTSYSNGDLTCNTTYHYRIRAYNMGGNSSYSNKAKATTATCPPAAPSSLIAIAASKNQINLLWTDNSNNESGFKIEQSPNDGTNSWTQIATVGANVTTYSNTGLSNTAYSFRVRSYSSGGNSNYSNIALAVTLDHTYHLPIVFRNF